MTKKSEQNVDRVRQFFVPSPIKFVRKASRKLAMLVMMVWNILSKRLRAHHFQMLWALKHGFPTGGP